jgi:uncharacterized DUF497 family protein
MGITMITDDGRFEWDDEKAKTNKEKHGLAFDEILPIFDDPNMIEYYDDAHSTIEEDRIIGIGILQGILILYVAYTERDERTRIISARKASPREEAKYYEQIKYAIS